MHTFFKVLIVCSTMFFSQSLKAQSKILADTVGIGTLNPTEELHVVGGFKAGTSTHFIRSYPNSSGDYTALYFGAQNAGDDNYIISYGSANTLAPYQLALKSNQGSNSSIGLWTDSNERLHIDNDGNVGIGTVPSNYKLHVLGTSLFTSVMKVGTRGYVQGHQDADNGHDRFFIGSGVYYENSNNRYNLSNNAEYDRAAIEFLNGGGIGFYTDTDNVTTYPYYSAAEWHQKQRMVILENGKVGIGTRSPDQRLTVKGKIHSEEIIVDLSVPAPDYVFAEEYNLPTLLEVESYIKKNKHLSEIPSAKEIEENGIILGEMNMSLLKKVEELTLYVIELEKSKNSQSKVIDQLIKRIEKLETKN